MKVETGGGGREVEDEERFGQVVGWQRGGERGGERVAGETGKGGGRPRVQEVFIKLGSQLRLVCSLRRATAKPTFLFWCLDCPLLPHKLLMLPSSRFHNDSMVNYEGGKGRIEVQRHTNGWGSTLLVNLDNVDNISLH